MKQQPNVLFLMTDQHRWDALGVHNPLIKTPNLDALIRRGVLFDQAVCQCPMCIPSRYSVKTGYYPYQVGVRNNCQSIQRSNDMPVKTIFERFKNAGYRTIGIGKTHWYLGPKPERGICEPDGGRRGFDVRCQARIRGGHDIEDGSTCWSDVDYDSMARVKAYNKKNGYGGEGPDGYRGETGTQPGTAMREHWLAGMAIENIKTARRQQRFPDKSVAPWLCMLSLDYPHAPLRVPPEYEALYDINDIPDFEEPPEGISNHFQPLENQTAAFAQWQAMDLTERRRTTLRYWALCSYVDAQMGRVLDFLQESGQDKNTIVAFTSDHGESLGQRGRFSKYSLYEASVRVPLVLAGPGVESGKTDSRPAELVDLAPTLLHLAGIEVPQSMPGEILVRPAVRSGAFSEMYANGNQEILRAPALMWRTPEWKLIIHFPGDVLQARGDMAGLQGELYNLKDDPQEYVNRWSEPALAELRERLTRELLYNMALNNAAYPRFQSHALTRRDG
jgi:arylsulfatase A-like enzyme